MVRSTRDAKRRRALRLLLHDPRALDALEHVLGDPRIQRFFAQSMAQELHPRRPRPQAAPDAPPAAPPL